jgi:hypothetical protein
MILKIRLNVLLLALATIFLAACASKMSEDDKLLWDESTNAPAAHH